jgi:hypothetical protein
MFGVTEATPTGQARREPGGGGSRPTQQQQSPRYTPSTAQAQADVDSGQSVAKKEGAVDESIDTGLRVSGDKATLGALCDCLHEASVAIGDNQDLADWAEQAYKACAQAFRLTTTSPSVTLPPFEETPDIDSFNDDPGTGASDED